MKLIKGIHYVETDAYGGHKHVKLGYSMSVSGGYGAALVLKSPRAGARLHAGCRVFTYAEAMAHWRGGKAPLECDCAECKLDYKRNAIAYLRPHHIALVKYAAAIAKTNGWKF